MRVEAGVLVQLDPEERRHLDDQGRRHRKTEDDDGIRWARARGPGIGGDNDELLPEAVEVLARELPERASRSPMRFTATRNASSVSSPASTRPYLLAQMVFQLRYVDGVDRLPAAEVAPPTVDLLLE